MAGTGGSGSRLMAGSPTRRLAILSLGYALAPVGPDAVGGAEQVLTALDRALVGLGHRSLVVAPAGSRVAGELVATRAAAGDDRRRGARGGRARRAAGGDADAAAAADRPDPLPRARLFADAAAIRAAGAGHAASAARLVSAATRCGPDGRTLGSTRSRRPRPPPARLGRRCSTRCPMACRWRRSAAPATRAAPSR